MPSLQAKRPVAAAAVEALHLEPSRWEGDKTYRVDPKKRLLVEVKRRVRGARPKRPS